MDEKERSRRRRQTEPYRAYHREYSRAWEARRILTPEQKAAKAAYLKAYRAANRARVAVVQRASERRRLYGLTPAMYREMLDQQEWTCPICERPLTENRTPSVDHDHRTLQVRGIICRRCNSALGMLDDNPELFLRAADYLLRSLFGPNSTMSSVLSNEP